LGNHDSGTGVGGRCDVTRLEGPDDDNNNEAESEEGQDGSYDDEGLMVL